MINPLTREEFNVSCLITLGIVIGSFLTSLLFLVDKSNSPFGVMVANIFFSFLYALFVIIMDKKLKQRGE